MHHANRHDEPAGRHESRVTLTAAIWAALALTAATAVFVERGTPAPTMSVAAPAAAPAKPAAKPAWDITPADVDDPADPDLIYTAG